MTASTSNPSIKTVPDSSALSSSKPTTLTVVVTDTNHQPAPNAQVSIEPSNASGKTNSQGEIQFKLGSASKYNVTVKLGSNTVTVPYYVTNGGAARLMVNPTYVKTVEETVARSQSLFPWLPLHADRMIGGVLGGLIVLYLVWKFVISKIFKKK